MNALEFIGVCAVVMTMILAGSCDTPSSLDCAAACARAERVMARCSKQEGCVCEDKGVKK